MHNALELGKQHFMQGIALFEQGQFSAAESAFTEALRHVPGRPSVLLNLGVTRVRLGAFADAITPLQEALAADPQMGDGWAALATAQEATGRWADALHALEQTLLQGLRTPEWQLRRARVLNRLGRREEALSAYQELLVDQPELAHAWVEMGEIHREAGRWSDAADAYREGHSRGADESWTRYLLAAVTGQGHVPRPPSVYVQNLFDDYAPDFDAHLVGTLGYQGHQTLIDVLPDGPLGGVLDLGCGTGLCGLRLHPRASRLIGVDLSAVMVSQAQARGLYDEVICADLHDWLPRVSERFNVMLAADVFIYVGELESAFAAIALALEPGGYLAFTVESGKPGSGAQLQPSLRYSHAPDYIRQLAANQGWAVLRQVEAPIRYDQGQPVMADYYLLQARSK